ncbi:hypothetical protein GCM10022225_52990 [Plantactinospora mayteni]|uniref:Uncharacterized protein n=1 Tax=Plantactinospora mayteni TaxID=566021 RepID=A0ABQ4EYU7_9ACTN|nr:hypothetical protein Pma05_63570 [Plantactinospora mayteni]
MRLPEEAAGIAAISAAVGVVAALLTARPRTGSAVSPSPTRSGTATGSDSATSAISVPLRGAGLTGDSGLTEDSELTGGAGSAASGSAPEPVPASAST